ncbi:MAG: DUF2231 domain-containing protein [Gammaproteobacteria bacterium]|nr:DUF2231 domain-containing protein [Gammaproteobacteria bacterium]
MPTSPIPSRMAIRGHPLHPAMVHFPVAALLGLIATDLAFLLTADAFWARASLWLAGVGALGGFLAGIVGMLDLLSVRQIRRLVSGWSHGLLAIMLLSLASLNWLLRLQDPVSAIFPWGLYLSVLSGVLIGVTGYLGGQLVYEYGVGVDIEGAQSRDTRP